MHKLVSYFEYLKSLINKRKRRNYIEAGKKKINLKKRERRQVKIRKGKQEKNETDNKLEKK